MPLDDHLIALLAAHRTAQSAERLRAGLGKDERGYVFANELGEPVSPDWSSDRFDRLTTGAGLPRSRLHDTRDTAATLMLAPAVRPKAFRRRWDTPT